MSDLPVLTFKGIDYLKLWRRTILQARKLVPVSSDGQLRMSDRLQVGLKKIERPVFILGCPRSGTTFLGNVLGTLPGGSYYFEPQAMKYFTRLIHEGKVTQAQVRRFYQWGARALLTMAPGNGKRFIEKNPKHTWVAEALLEVFPDAQFVILTRDGRDVALSLKEKPWHLAESSQLNRREPGGYRYGPYPHFYIEPERRGEYEQTSDLHRCIWIWRQYAEEVERLRKVIPEKNQFHLTYEDLILQSERTMDSLLNYLREDDPEAREAVMGAVAKAHQSSVGRGSKAFSEDEMMVIRKEAGSLLDQLGYHERDALVLS